ncbi:MAG TPA: dephospho-CoA kinase [Vicinamibacterales bacterium]|jgi:dephospho-CoA kinase
MLRAALTGGIATGKSYCLAHFARLGAATIDADRLAREVVQPGTPALARVAERFGRGLIQPDGTLDRAGLGRIVFADRTARADLEAIIHPEVYRRIAGWFANLPSGTRVAIADIPLLFETGHQHDFDRVIVAACDSAEQFRRLVVRDGLTPEAARARLDAQWPIEAKVARAHFVIRTDGTFAETDLEVARAYEALLREV